MNLTEYQSMTNNALYAKAADGQVFFGDKGAAGSLVLSQRTGRLMLQMRSENVQEPGTWGTIGGAIEEGSNPRRAAADEMFEETGYEGPMRLEPLKVFRTPGGEFFYHNFLTIVDDEFTPWQDHESGGTQWFEFGEWPQPLHFGLENLLADPQSMDTLKDFVERAKAGENLLDDAKPERTLYHAMYKPAVGDAIQPLSLRTEFGRENHYVYATPFLSKALVYAFNYHNGKEIIMNTAIDGTPEEIAIIINRDETMAAPRPVKVYAFSDNGFDPIPGARQSVSTRAVALDKTRVVFETNDVRDVMLNGVQIFSLQESMEQLQAEGFFDKYLVGKSTEEALYQLLKEGRIHWENLGEGAGGPNPVLVDTFKKLDARDRESPNTAQTLSGSDIQPMVP
jgi:8-oxo-dGTP pyrophosphatase MutT (NUDIX family)